MKRDAVIDVFRGLAILTVVLGHIEGVPPSTMPIYSFHMPMFFFISGLFYSENIKKSTFSALLGLTQRHILPAAGVILLYAFVQSILNHFDIMKGDPALSGVFMFGTKLLDTYWYLGCFFCVYAYFYLVHQKIASRIQNFFFCRSRTLAHCSMGFYFCVAVLCLYISSRIYEGVTPESRWDAVAEHRGLIILLRIAFGCFFYYLGSYFTLLKGSRPVSPRRCFILLALSFAVHQTCFYFAGYTCEFSMQIMNFYNYVTPVITSVCGTFIFYFSAALVVRFAKWSEGIFSLLGKRSFSIMSHHVFGFVLLNIVFMLLGFVEKPQLDDPYFTWHGKQTYLLYFAVGVLYPLLFSQLVSSIQRYFNGLRSRQAGH